MPARDLILFTALTIMTRGIGRSRAGGNHFQRIAWYFVAVNDERKINVSIYKI